MNRKQRRRKGGTGPVGPQQFEKELAKVVNGDPSADPTVAAFWREFADAGRVVVAVPHPEGIEVLRRTSGGAA